MECDRKKIETMTLQNVAVELMMPSGEILVRHYHGLSSVALDRDVLMLYSEGSRKTVNMRYVLTYEVTPGETVPVD